MGTLNSADYVKMNFAINTTPIEPKQGGTGAWVRDLFKCRGDSRLVDNEFSPQMRLSSLILTFFYFFSATQVALLRETTIGQAFVLGCFG